MPGNWTLGQAGEGRPVSWELIERYVFDPLDIKARSLKLEGVSLQQATRQLQDQAQQMVPQLTSMFPRFRDIQAEVNRTVRHVLNLEFPKREESQEYRIFRSARGGSRTH